MVMSSPEKKWFVFFDCLFKKPNLDLDPRLLVKCAIISGLSRKHLTAFATANYLF